MGEAIERGAAIDPVVLERASRVIRVVGHPLRLRLLELLEAGERNVTDLVLSTAVNQAMVSQQLRILRAEGVVGDRREGTRVFYRITEPKVSRILDCIRECDIAGLLDSPPVARSGLRVVASAPVRRSGGERTDPPANP